MPAYNPSIPIYPKGHLFGMTLSNNGSDATNDIDFAAGQCVDSTGVAFMVGTALTKQLDATWAAGTNAGGRMSAAAIANTTYHCFAIRKDSDGTVDYGFDVSATAPTMPTGYTYFRRIGSIIRSGATILAFTQRGDTFHLVSNGLDVDTHGSAAGSSAVTRALASVPLGIVVEPIISIGLLSVTAGAGAWVSSLTQTDQAAAAGNHHVWVAAASEQGPQTTVRGVFTNTSAQIRTRENQTDSQIRIRTYGWIDTRGRLA